MAAIYNEGIEDRVATFETRIRAYYLELSEVTLPVIVVSVGKSCASKTFSDPRP